MSTYVNLRIKNTKLSNILKLLKKCCIKWYFFLTFKFTLSLSSSIGSIWGQIETDIENSSTQLVRLKMIYAFFVSNNV